jgi:hypothetical protein
MKLGLIINRTVQELVTFAELNLLCKIKNLNVCTVKFSTAFNNFLLKFNPTIKSLAIPFWARPFNGRVNESASGFCFFGTYQKPCAHPQNLAVLIRSTAAKGKTGKQERKVIFVNPHIKFCSV